MTRTTSLVLMLFVTMAVTRAPSQVPQVSRAVIAAGGLTVSDDVTTSTWTMGQPLIGAHGADGSMATWGFWPSIGFARPSGAPIPWAWNASLGEPALRIAPNPARDRAELLTSRSLAAASVIIVSDMSGRELMRWSAPSSRTRDEPISLDVSELATGTYVVLVRDEDSTLATLFTVSH